MATPRKQYPKPKPTGAPKLRIREITEHKKGKTYRAFRVEGYRDRETGRRIQRQFKTRDKAEAFVATEQVARLNNVALNTVTTRLTHEQVVDAEAAFKRLGNRGTLEAAVALYLGKVAMPEEPKPLREALTAFLIGKEEAGRRQVSIRQLESTVSRFITFAQGKGLNDVHEIDSDAVESFLQSLRAKNGVDRATPKTRRNYRLDLSSFFNWCAEKKRRWILSNPCEDIEDDTIVDEPAPPEVLTIWQAARLMRDAETYADGALVRYFALTLFAGVRPGSVHKDGEIPMLASQPELIDLKKGVITIPAPTA
jgi:hypothetical protein